jgi:hypothetical protein
MSAQYVAWREPAGDPECVLDRDARAARYAGAKGAGRARLEPAARSAAWGGALSRVADAGLAPSREDEGHLYAAAGRHVPVSFARYVSPVIDPYGYEHHRIAGWRVAVPRGAPAAHVEALLRHILRYGPRSAGYARLGDTLVPADLEAGDRAALAETAGEYEP